MASDEKDTRLRLINYEQRPLVLYELGTAPRTFNGHELRDNEQVFWDGDRYRVGVTHYAGE